MTVDTHSAPSRVRYPWQDLLKCAREICRHGHARSRHPRQRRALPLTTINSACGSDNGRTHRFVIARALRREECLNVIPPHLRCYPRAPAMSSPRRRESTRHIKPSYRLSQFGFSASIRSIFHCLRHFFICFSRRIAPSISVVDSYQTRRCTPYLLTNPSCTSFLCCQTRWCRLLVTPM